LSLSLEAVHSVAAAVWPPAGIALVALLLYGYSLWPGIACAAFLVHLSVGMPLLAAGGVALGHTLEAVLGAVLLARVVRFRPSLERLQDAGGVVVLAAGLSTLVSATLGVTSGWLGGVIPAAMYGETWRTWWLGDALGVLVVAPLLFVWSERGRVAQSWRWSAEALILLVVVGVLSLVIFDVVVPPLTLPAYLILPYLVFPALIGVALRLGPPGAVTALALMAASALWGTTRGVGPFASLTLPERLFGFQHFTLLTAGTILILAAVIAERRRAEADAHEQRERLHVTLSSIGDAVLATDSQGRVTLLNPVAEVLTGWPAAAALGQSITAVLHIVNECTRQAVENPIAKVLHQGRVVGLANHTLLIARDGVERPIDDSAAPIRDAQGRLLGTVLVFRDITTRRQAELTREYLAAIVESSDDAVIGMTLDGKMTSWNRGAEALYEYTAAEVIGQPITLLCPPEIPDEIPALLERLARGERIAHYETQRVRKDGTRLDVSLTVSPIRESTGRIIGASKIARDITERKRLEAALQQAYVTLEQRVQERTAALVAANETLSREIAERQRLEREAQRAEHLALLGRLAAGVSHELRNPLGAIFLYVDLLEEELRSPSPESHEETVQALAEIKMNLGRVDDIVQDYLSLARVTQMERTPQDLGAAVRAWVEEWQGTAAAHGVTLQLDGLADLGTVPCHASSLRRVVLNLIQNALDAMPQGGTLTVTGAGTATHVHLQVRDTGSGILPEQLPRLFEPLYTTKAKGTGLGLYIVQQIVAAHGGEVTVHSRVRQGTTFTLTLPRAREQSPAWPRLVAPCHADAALATRTGCDPRPPERHT
jgi:PAS domain S-box-containing protein